MTRANAFYPSASSSRPTLRDVAHLLSTGKAKNVVCLVGAGISTAAGIPDFRSPETGLYANLAKYNLPYPEAIFDMSYFPQHPEPFYALAKEIYPGNFLPTLTHYFFTLLHKKGILLRCFTQNIDTLERAAGLPEDKIVEAHGSFATATCLKCSKVSPGPELKDRVDKMNIIYCDEPSCKDNKDAIVKPDIVFFGENLPARFWDTLDDLEECDLLLVLGTSLQVSPFSTLIDQVSKSCPRVLINLESVGEMSPRKKGGGLLSSFRHRESSSATGFDFNGYTTGSPHLTRDVRWLGLSDDGVFELASLCGWKDELEKLFSDSNATLSQKWGLNSSSSIGTSLSEIVDKVGQVALESEENSTKKDDKEEEEEIERTEKQTFDKEEEHRHEKESATAQLKQNAKDEKEQFDKGDPSSTLETVTDQLENVNLKSNTIAEE